MLPDLIVIGAMKCGTSALHEYLAAHPAICMARQKEVNFFNGPDCPPPGDDSSWWRTGQWHRGVDWYADQFDASAPLRGEASPAYTSPDSPEAPPRMASVVPEVRLLYLVRDPLDRALSQYAHHRRDGAEPRDVWEALLDPDSQYVARSRYFERLRPYLRAFDREQVHVVVRERLLTDRCRELARVYAHVGADPDWRCRAQQREFHVGHGRVEPSRRLRAAFAERVADDVLRLRELLGQDLAEWSL
jgi:Sulfotransferase family